MEKKKKLVGLHGSYFGRNFGDTLILWIIKNWIEEIEPDCEILLPFVNSDMEAKEILEKENSQRELKEIDVLIFGPGGYFGEPPWSFLKKLYWSLRNYGRHLKWNNILYKKKIPYAIIGVGVGPLTFGFIKKRVIKLFRNATIISVRDNYSKEYLIDWGIAPDRINVISDVALTLTPSNIEKPQNPKKEKVGLHLNNLDKFNLTQQESIIDFVINLNMDYDLYLVEDIENQVDFYREGNVGFLLNSKGLRPKVINYKSPTRLIKELSDFNYIITSKLHVGIVSYALGIPVLSIPFHSKTIRFYEQIKREKFCVYNVDFSQELLLNLFQELKNNKIVKNELYANAIKNKNLLIHFLIEKN